MNVQLRMPEVVLATEPFTLDVFQELAAGTAVYTDPRRPIESRDSFLIEHMQLELLEFANADSTESKLSEAGDCLWYVSEIALLHDTRLSQIAGSKTESLAMLFAKQVYGFIGSVAMEQDTYLAEIGLKCIQKNNARSHTDRGNMPACAPTKVLIGAEVHLIRPCGENRQREAA